MSFRNPNIKQNVYVVIITIKSYTERKVVDVTKCLIVTFFSSIIYILNIRQ